MKKTSLYISAVMLGAVGLAGCSNHWELPPALYPTEADNVEATITIADLKALYWDDANTDYVTKVVPFADGTNPIIKGTIVSSTAAGNINKAVYIQDATGAICLSVDTNRVENVLPMGAEIAIDMAGLEIGRYRGLSMIGNDNNGTVGRIPYRDLRDNIAMGYFGGEIDTITADLGEIAVSNVSTALLLKWESQLVRFNNVHFMEAGLDFCDVGGATNRTIADESGHRLTVRTSSDADFAFTRLPLGNGDVVGVLSYYNGWQLLLNDAEGCIGFAGGSLDDIPQLPSPDGDGSETSPYNCASVIAMAPASTTVAVESGVWMSGYIVGYYENYAGHYTAEGASNTNILMSDIPTPAYDAQCVSVQLPAGDVRSALNLSNNPTLLGVKVAVYGDVMKYNSLPGIKNTTAYIIDGTVGGNPGGGEQPDPPTGVISVAEAIALIQAGSTATVQVSGVVSSVKSFYSQYGQIDYYIVDEGQTQQLQVYNGLGLNGAEFKSKEDIEVGAKVVVQGPLTDYNGTPELNRGNFLISYTAPDGSTGGGGGTELPPVTPGDGTSETFSASLGLPGSASTASSTPETYTSAETGITYTVMGCYLGTYSGESYLMINGKNFEGAYISFSLAYDLKQLQMTTTSGCSEKPESTVNIYADGQLIQNLAVNVHNKTFTVDIPAEYQKAGTVYKVESGTKSYNQQFANFTYVKAE